MRRQRRRWVGPSGVTRRTGRAWSAGPSGSARGVSHPLRRVLLWSQRHSQSRRRPPSEAAQLADIEQARAALRDVVRRPIPERLGRCGSSVVALFSEAERAAASGVALFSPWWSRRGSYTKAGHGSAAEWLGTLSGSSAGAAKGRLAAAERAATDPLLTEALHDAELSSAQLKVVSDTWAGSPGATGDPVGPDRRGGFAPRAQRYGDPAARRRPSPRGRARPPGPGHTNAALPLASGRPEGGVRGEFFCDEVAWARVAPRTRGRRQGALEGGGEWRTTP